MLNEVLTLARVLWPISPNPRLNRSWQSYPVYRELLTFNCLFSAHFMGRPTGAPVVLWHVSAPFRGPKRATVYNYQPRKSLRETRAREASVSGYGGGPRGIPWLRAVSAA